MVCDVEPNYPTDAIIFFPFYVLLMFLESKGQEGFYEEVESQSQGMRTEKRFEFLLWPLNHNGIKDRNYKIYSARIPVINLSCFQGQIYSNILKVQVSTLALKFPFLCFGYIIHTKILEVLNLGHV